MSFFHYKAGGYEVTLDDPADFGMFSDVLITFTSINGIDINIFAPDFFPPLAGGAVSFHADFARFTPPPIFASDALPTNTDLGAASFDDGNVTLLPPNSVVTSSNVTSLTLTPVLPGDYNQNGVVDAADYTVWRDNLGSDTAIVNDDTPGVMADDYDRWKAHFGETAGNGSASDTQFSTAVPEPATLVLLEMEAIGICLFWDRTARANTRLKT